MTTYAPNQLHTVPAYRASARSDAAPEIRGPAGPRRMNRPEKHAGGGHRRGDQSEPKLGMKMIDIVVV